MICVGTILGELLLGAEHVSRRSARVGRRLDASSYWQPFHEHIPHRIEERERRQIGYYQASEGGRCRNFCHRDHQVGAIRPFDRRSALPFAGECVEDGVGAVG